MNEMEKKYYVLTFWSLVGLVVAEESGRVGGDGRKRRKRACGCGWGWENEMVIDCSYYMWILRVNGQGVRSEEDPRGGHALLYFHLRVWMEQAQPWAASEKKIVYVSK